MIFDLIHLINELRKGYGEFQDSSVVGQSEMDRQSRRLVNMICWSLIALLVIAVILWACLAAR